MKKGDGSQAIEADSNHDPDEILLALGGPHPIGTNVTGLQKWLKIGKTRF